MATSKTTNTYNRLNWEDSDFPILCQTCLGDNPYIRMTKDRFGKECKICVRPFTIFRWCPGAKMRFKKTEICQTCSRLKNVCQTCLLDLEYGLPIQVRDDALKLKDNVPKSDVNREYFIQNAENQLEKSESIHTGRELGKSQAASDLLLKLARTKPYYRRNRPHICSFWVKGECKRGEECPYRHEKPTDPDDPLADQNIKDRYYGIDDPVAEKLLGRAAAMPKLDPPEDKTVTTIYVGNLGEKITEKDLRDEFYQHGEIRSVVLISRQGCAFVQYTTRDAAEVAVDRTFNKLIMHGRRLTIKWGKAQAQPAISSGAENAAIENGPTVSVASSQPVPGLPRTLPLPPEELQHNFFNLPPTFPPPHIHRMMPPPAANAHRDKQGPPNDATGNLDIPLPPGSADGPIRPLMQAGPPRQRPPGPPPLGSRPPFAPRAFPPPEMGMRGPLPPGMRPLAPPRVPFFMARMGMRMPPDGVRPPQDPFFMSRGPPGMRMPPGSAAPLKNPREFMEQPPIPGIEPPPGMPLRGAAAPQKAFYPSQDPERMGSTSDKATKDE